MLNHEKLELDSFLKTTLFDEKFQKNIFQQLKND
jgi:hypothetical protein